MLYYTNQSVITDQVLEHLPGRFDKKPLQRQVSIGPEGSGGGCVFSVDDSQLGFFPDQQTWTKIKAFPGKQASGFGGALEHAAPTEYWFGFNHVTGFDPSRFLRDDYVSGHYAIIRKMMWMIPQVRLYQEHGGEVIQTTKLPVKAEYKNGQWLQGGVVERYRRLVEIGDLVFESTYGGTTEGDDTFRIPDESVELCAELLMLNYRIGPEEISALGLIEISVDSLWDILKLVIDEPGIIELIQKKTAVAETNS